MLRALLASFIALGVVACGADANAPPIMDADAAPPTEAGAPEGGSIEAGQTDAGADSGSLCSVNNGGCDPNATCDEAAGHVVCTCKPGYQSSGGTCVDVDECTTNNGGCDAHATCKNTVGGRTCTCNPGFTGNGTTCADVDECAADNGGCSADATCKNTVGGRTCTCNPGYDGDGGTCSDIDECANNNGGCHPLATCTNAIGGRNCVCIPGYGGDGVNACNDIDECANNNGGCNANATCTNTIGGRTCACKPGFTGTGIGADCTLTTTTITTTTNLSVTNTGSRACDQGGDMVSYSVLELTSTTAQLQKKVNPGCLSPGDNVLLINLQAASIAINTGEHEVLTVASVANDVVTFTSPKTKWYGKANGNDDNIGVGVGEQRVVLQRIPRYGNFVVNAGAKALAHAWGGLGGGVFALSAAGAVTVDGSIDMSGRGYTGGSRTTSASTTGMQGETTIGLGKSGQSLFLGGGGGGRGDNTECRTYGSGGGGGGHGIYGARGGDPDCSGAGGTAYGEPTLKRLTLGSGGGAGGTDNDLATNPPGGAGGAGGGIIFITADGAVTGTFLSNGRDGEGDDVTNCLGPVANFCWDYSGPGGGGAGGAILIKAPSFTGSAQANGGLGGMGNSTYARSAGNGGTGWVKTP